MKIYSTLFLLFFFIPVHSQFRIYNSSNTPSMTSDMVKSVVVSSEDNNKWFGTEDGLLMFDGTNWSYFSSAGDNIPGDNIYDISYDQTTLPPSLWIGTGNGAGQILLEDELKINPPYRVDNSGIAGNEVYATGVNPNSTTLFGTNKGVSFLYENNWRNVTGLDSMFLADNPVSSIASSEDGYSYVATTGKGVYQYESDEVDGVSLVTIYALPYNALPSDNITCVFVDRKGNQWYGSPDGAGYHEGIAAKEGWTYFSTADGLPDNHVNAIYEDKKGYIWFGTNNGLALLKDETWTIYTIDDGLSGNVILDIAEDDEQVMWIATDNGITSYKPIWAGAGELPVKTGFNLNVHPNPARDGVWIRFRIPRGGPTRLSVYDLSGRKVKELEYGFRVQGEHEVFWNTAYRDGHFVEEGIYVIKIESNNLSSTRKLVIMR